MTHFFRQGYAAIANAYVGDGAKIDLLLIPELSTVLEHPVVQGAIAQILGGSDLRLETSKLMAVEVGEAYRQDWHCDIPLIFEWWPNNVQCNMALNAAAFYWTIPGSNRHASSDQERRANAALRRVAQSPVIRPFPPDLPLRKPRRAPPTTPMALPTGRSATIYSTSNTPTKTAASIGATPQAKTSYTGKTCPSPSIPA